MEQSSADIQVHDPRYLFDKYCDPPVLWRIPSLGGLDYVDEESLELLKGVLVHPFYPWKVDYGEIQDAATLS